MAAALPLIAYTRLNYNSSSSSRHTITKEMKEGGEKERISFSVYTIYHFIVLNDENSISEQITTISYTYKTVLITYSFIHLFDHRRQFYSEEEEETTAAAAAEFKTFKSVHSEVWCS